MNQTDYVYVCGAEYWRHLFLSMRTLFASGTRINTVTVYVVGGGGKGWPLKDPRIRIVEVPNLNESYWYENKLHLCNSDASRVVFLDTDVMVLKPIDKLYQSIEDDIIARHAVRTYTKYWHPRKWEKALKDQGIDSSPLLSDGFMIFQNNAHKRIRNSWKTLLDTILHGESLIKPSRFAELEAFSMAIGRESMTLSLMPDYGHRYAMIGESHTDAIVYHLGTPSFYKHYLPIEKGLGLHRRNDLPVPRPRFNKAIDIIGRARHRFKRKIYGSRDKPLSW